MGVPETEPSPILIEVEAVNAKPVSGRGAMEGEEAGKAEDALKRLKEIGGSIAEVCESIQQSVSAGLKSAEPDEFTLEFGVKIGAEGGAIISKVSGEAALKVTATWRK